MTIRQADIQDIVSFEDGVDDTTAIGHPSLANTLSKCLNCDFVDDSLLIKRRGYVRVNSAADWGTRRIRKGFEYAVAESTFEELLYGEDSTPTGTSGILAKVNGTGSPTTILSGLKDGVKPSIIQFRNLIMVFNGTNDFLYDGTTTRQIGITAPGSAPTLNATIDGSLDQNTPYLVAYSYYNSTTGAESSPSPPATLTTGGTAVTDGLRINVTSADATIADKIRVYRSVGAGDVLFFLKDVAGTSTTVDLTEADSSLDLGFRMEEDNSRLPGTAKYAVVNDSRVFVAGFTANPNRVYPSKIGINGPMPESFQADDFADCNINDGDRIIALGKASNYTIIIKKNSVGRLNRIDFNINAAEITGSTKYIYEEISGDINSVGNGPVVFLDSWCVWLGKDDVYATDGTQLLRLGKRVRNTLKTFNFDNAYKFDAVNKKDSQQIIFAVCRSGESEPDFQVVGHYRNLPKIAWSYYSPGTDTATHPGLRASAMWEATINGQKQYYFGSSNAVGRVYRFDSGTNDDTLGIYWDIRKAWDRGATPASNKLFHSFYWFVFGNGAQYNLEHTFEANASETLSAQASTAITVGSGTAWGAANWEAFNWSDLAFQLVKFFPRKRAYYGRAGVHNYNADQPVAIKAGSRILQNYPIHR